MLTCFFGRVALRGGMLHLLKPNRRFNGKYFLSLQVPLQVA
jgi:hypothetical protein